MKKLLIVLTLFGVLAMGLYSHQRELQRCLFQKMLSTSTREFFNGSLRLKEGYIDKELKMHLHDIQGTLTSDGGPAAIQLKEIHSETSLFQYFTPQGTRFHFEGIAPQGSSQEGISGRAELKSEGGGHFHLDAKIEALDLSEIQWMNPDNLKGSKGTFSGTITSDGKFSENPNFQLFITSKNGLVQAKFFSLLLPYLPAMPTKDRMAKLSQEGAVLPFKDAAIRAEMSTPEKMKIFLHILIPDYNVALNINFEIRLEDTVTFSQLFQTLGLLKVKP